MMSFQASMSTTVASSLTPAGKEVSPDVVSRLINLAGRQRMLSQRLVLFAMLAKEQRANALSTARDTWKLMRDSHQLLVTGGDGLPGIFSTQLEDVFHGQHAAHNKVQSFISLADRVLLALGSSVQRDADKDLSSLVDAATEILAILNIVTQSYEREARDLAQVLKEQRVRLIEDIQAVSREAKVVAFNAQVAAHRAGQAGREFAVVAARMSSITDEVDALAREALRAR